MLKDYENGKLDLELYLEKNTTSRKSYARTKLKKRGYGAKDLKTISTKRRLQCEEYNYDSDLLYEEKSGLVVRPITNELCREFKTVGIDRRCNGKIKKLTIADVKELSDTVVTFDFKSLDEEAVAYLQKY